MPGSETAPALAGAWLGVMLAAAPAAFAGAGAGDSNGPAGIGVPADSQPAASQPASEAEPPPAASQPASQAASGPASQEAATPLEQLHQSLRLLQAGRYADAERLATALAADPSRPMPRAWLVAAQARQLLRQFHAAAEAYKSFLAASDTPIGRQYVQRQLRLCEAAAEPAYAASPPSSRLTDLEKTLLAVVEANEAVESTEHFVVTARNAALARLLAQEAESAMKRICGFILGGQEYPHRVEIHVWIDRQDYLTHASGALSWSGGSFTLARSAGVVRRRIDLAQLDEKKALSLATVDRAMPHELCHLVVAEFFGDAPCPLFLNEALAMLAEPQLDNDRLLLAGTALAGRGKIPLANLLVAEAGRIDKPELFYAESYSLLLYLRQRLGERALAAMIENMKNGSPLAEAIQRALNAPEDHDFLKLLEAAWEKHAVEQAQYIRALRAPATRPARTIDH